MAVQFSFPMFPAMELSASPSSSPLNIFAAANSFSSARAGETPRLAANSASFSSCAAPRARCFSPSRPCHSSCRSFFGSRSGGSEVRGSKRQIVIRASTEVGAAGSDPPLSKFSEFKDAIWRFLRPHTIRGTVLGSTSLVARALLENKNLINWWLLPKALSGLLALICGNGFIVGINQIYDVEIDRVNKPYLPIAAGDLTAFSAWLLVLSFAALGFLIVALNFGPFISSLYCLGLFLGTIYSVPPFRLKKFPVAAFLIIATVRGFLLNFGVYYATRAALGLTFEWSLPVAFITSFVTLFALVIAITKDLPDVEGDRKFQISTFATKLGVRNISFLGSGLLLANYIAAILVAVYVPQAFRRIIMIPAHGILALCLVFQVLYFFVIFINDVFFIYDFRNIFYLYACRRGFWSKLNTPRKLSQVIIGLFGISSMLST